ncbi:MAG: sodium:alanine symporter family protein [Dethiobacter sp.]|jgi:AGCS family alanine or glycine:cation symporter|nr:sodium:alanine symporter family protein [Dethiobacter sp.]MBS3901542.1 sodium:alanine symporter family protein [Dethiobacter sp.]MBS3989436.1 sodium:alanine symporter family protein [Dethiobacter sp.]
MDGGLALGITEIFGNFNQLLHDFVGGPVLTAAILTTGIFLTVRCKFLQLRCFNLMLKETIFGIFQTEKSGRGEMTPFQALTTALAATIGTGNIAGVATAITLGGPGAIFWMWVSAFFGMVTKYAEVVLAVHYRQTSQNGMVVGGPMYFLEYGLKKRFLAVLFALFASLAAFGIGNMVQANSAADAMHQVFNIPPLLTGVVLSIATALVILGGIQRVAALTAKLIPLMSVFYLLAALIILFWFADRIPAAFAAIIGNAFTGTAAVGGFAGAGVLQAFRFGVARGIFTNEAGLGSASIAHATAKTDHPARQGLWGMFEVFFDTHLVCTITAVTILVTGVWIEGLEGAALTTAAFSRGLPGIGGYVVALSLIFFAFSTLVAWSFYGEKCCEYLAGTSSVMLYRVVWILLIPVGAMGGLRTVWALADTLNGLMAIPNLIGLWGLSGVVIRLTREFFRRR